MSELTFLYGEYAPRCTHHIDKQYMGYQTLQYMSGGAVDLWVGKEHYALRGRWFWSAYPGPRIRFHAAEAQGHWVHRYVAFQGPLLKKWKHDGLFPITPRQPPGDADYGPRFDELLRQSRRPDRTGVRRAIHLLEGMLIELADAPHPSAEPIPWMDAMIDRLTAPNAEPPNYSEMATEVGISESTLRRAFRKKMGTSPHAFRLQAVAAEARRLLAETRLPIKSVAAQLGYRDIYFFSRQFRQLTGMPPAVYRKSVEG